MVNFVTTIMLHEVFGVYILITLNVSIDNAPRD